MMEILINERDWQGVRKTRRLSKILSDLSNYGWEKFGHSGTIVLFKDVTKEKATNELDSLNISEVKAEVWEEDLYESSIF